MRQVSSLLLAGSLVLAAGCQVAVTPQAQPGTESTIGTVARPKPTQPGATTGTPATNGPIGSITPGQETVGELVPAAPALHPVLQSAKAMAVSAETGARYQSSDGLVTADIPPGVLTQDATVRIARIETERDPATRSYMPGIRFALDLGGALLKPDTQIMVRAKLDPRAIDLMKDSDPAFSPEKYNLSQDANGVWTMAMPVKGPSSTSATAPAGPIDMQAILLAEFGGLVTPAAAGADAPKAYKVQATVCEQWEAALGVPVPKNMDQWFALEHRGVFDCGGVESTSWGWAVLSGLGWFGGGVTLDCVINPPKPVNLPSRVTYVSDDPALNGKPAAGSVVRFAMPSSNLNGPSEVVADGNGNATSYGPKDGGVGLFAYTSTASGPAVSATIKEGMAPVQLSLPNYSPLMNLALGHAGTLSGNAIVSYSLDGADKQITLPVSGNLQFRVIMPDNNNHTFQLKGVTAGGAYAKAPMPGALAIRRNGSYSLGRVEMVKNADGQVIERVAAAIDNARTPHQADQAGFDGVTVSNFADVVDGKTQTNTAGGGRFSFVLWADQGLPAVNANYKGLVSRNGNAAPYRIELRTDSSYTVKLGGVFDESLAGKAFIITYTVDGERYEKSFQPGTDGSVTLTFARDTRDDKLDLKVLKVVGPGVESIGALPAATLAPTGSGEGSVTLAFTADTAK